MKLSKTTLLGTTLLAATGFGASSAFADPIFIDVGAAGSAGTTVGIGTDPGTTTGVVNEWQLFADTTTTLFDTVADATVSVGDTFTDSGDAVFTSPLPSVDNEGIGAAGGSAITITWRDIAGEITSTGADPAGVRFQQEYTSGTFDFYFQDIGALAYDFGEGVGVASTGATGGSVGIADNSGFTTGTPILSLNLVNGTGDTLFAPDGITYLTGSFNIDFEVTSVLNDFWFFEDGMGGTDFFELLASSIIIGAQADANTNNVRQIPGGPDGALFQVESDHDGSVSFQRGVDVPTPGSLALFGLGALMLGFRLRRS